MIIIDGRFISSQHLQYDASTESTAQKETQRRAIAQQVDAFISRGGVITHVPDWASGLDRTGSVGCWQTQSKKTYGRGRSS